VKSPNNCGQTSCAARSRGVREARTESAHRNPAGPGRVADPATGLPAGVVAHAVPTISAAIATR
jgi:hypothetical protein